MYMYMYVCTSTVVLNSGKAPLLSPCVNIGIFNSLSIPHLHYICIVSDLTYLQSLVQEAVDKSYCSSEVYDELQATMQEVKKYANTAVQLVTTKPKTRYSNVDVREVKEFLSQVESLPCKLPEADVLKVREM